MRPVILSLTLAAYGLGTPCVWAQDRPKPITLPVGSKFTDANQAGVNAFRSGKFGDALHQFDLASVEGLGSSIPWTNGSLTNLELGRLAQAGRTIQLARAMGDDSARGRIFRIEIDTARGQFTVAKRVVKDVEFIEPEDPYLHVARAKLARSFSNSRVAERSLWQAYRSGREVLLDSKLYDAARVAPMGGSPDALGLKLSVRNMNPHVGFVADVRGLTESLGGSDHLMQRALQADASASTAFGTFMGSYRGLRSERLPGLAPPGLTPSKSVLDLSYGVLGWQTVSGAWTVHANYREAAINLRQNALLPMIRDNFETQWMAEARFDSGSWTAGGGWSRVYRDSVANPALEPLEEIFGQGTTALGHAYAVQRTRYGDDIRLITGGVATWVDGKAHGLFTSEVAIRLLGERFLKIGAKPTLNRVGSNLFPEDLRAGPLGENPIDRVFESSLDINRSVNLFTPTGKSLEIYLELPLVQSASTLVQLTAFQKQFTDAQFQSGDPQQQPTSQWTALGFGKISGMTATASKAFSNDIQGSFSTTLQTSAAELDSIGPEGQVPYVPNLHAALTLDVNRGDTSIALTANYVGPRLHAASLGLTSTTFLPPAWGIDLHVRTPAMGGQFVLSALNLANARFYGGSLWSLAPFGWTGPGAPANGSSSFVIGYQGRY